MWGFEGWFEVVGSLISDAAKMSTVTLFPTDQSWKDPDLSLVVSCALKEDGGEILPQKELERCHRQQKKSSSFILVLNRGSISYSQQ